jgi:hypothetical protein
MPDDDKQATRDETAHGRPAARDDDALRAAPREHR